MLQQETIAQDVIMVMQLKLVLVKLIVNQMLIVKHHNVLLFSENVVHVKQPLLRMLLVYV